MGGGGERAGGEKPKVQTMSIYNADAVYVLKEAFEKCACVCVCVCVCVCLSRCRSLTKDLQKAHESF